MSIRCGHCGGIHASVADVRDCSTENGGENDMDNTTMNPVVPDPGDADSYRDFIVPMDPWEGATEGEAGVWSPGPAAYLNARREPPRDPSGHYPAPQPQSEEWGNYKKAVEELTVGFYAFEDDIYQTVMSGKGRLYAKILNGDTGSWTYAAGAVMKLKPEMRLKLDDAKAFGHRTGRCGCCGRTLTNPESIELGIGPICAERYF